MSILYICNHIWISVSTPNLMDYLRLCDKQICVSTLCMCVWVHSECIHNILVHVPGRFVSARLSPSRSVSLTHSFIHWMRKGVYEFAFVCHNEWLGELWSISHYISYFRKPDNWLKLYKVDLQLLLVQFLLGKFFGLKLKVR